MAMGPTARLSMIEACSSHAVSHLLQHVATMLLCLPSSRHAIETQSPAQQPLRFWRPRSRRALGEPCFVGLGVGGWDDEAGILAATANNGIGVAGVASRLAKAL